VGADKSTPGQRLVPVLAGGGTRLAVHVGVLAALRDLGKRYDRLVGVSGGSIVAALHAAGMSPPRLLELLLDVDFTRFRGRSLVELVRRGGLCSGDVFEQWIDDLLEGRRFADMDLDLVVVATDVCAGKPVVFERRTTPSLKVAHAVRCSMGIPLLFSFQPWEGGLLVDGSILSEDALHADWSGDGTPVFLFRMRGEAESRPASINRWFPLSGYVYMLIRTFMTTISREFIDARHWPRTVVIETGHYSPLEFRFDRSQKEDQYRRGYATTMQILPFKLDAPAGDAPAAAPIPSSGAAAMTAGSDHVPQ
jgi:NTE family protein